MNRVFEKIRTFLGLSESAQRWMWAIVLLFTFTLVVRLGMLGFFSITNPDFLYDDDSAGYITLAENLENGNGFSWDSEPPYMPNSYRTPGYPMFLAAHRIMFGSFFPALVTQILLSLLTAYLILRIGDRFFSVKAGVIASAIFLFMPFSLLTSIEYMTQVTFTAALLGAVWFWLEYLSKGYAKYLVLASLLLPVAALIRPIAILIVVPLIASLVYARFLKQASWKKVIGASLVLVVVFLAGIAPWMWRNYETFGNFALSSLVPHQLYFYDAPSIYAASHGITHTEARNLLTERISAITGISYALSAETIYMQFSELTPILKEEGVKIMLEDPFALITTRAVQLGKFFVRDGVRNWIERFAGNPGNGVGFGAVVIERFTLATIALGFFFAALRGLIKKDVSVVFIALIVLYFAGLTGVMAAAGLRYPAEPLLLLLGTAGLFELYTLGRSKFLKKTA